ncbi:MAG: hypothetical protein KKD35_01665 [Elusimicrobia bacterium]|nr:hypothetical protein [Elusimicrobiota bacterium]
MKFFILLIFFTVNFVSAEDITLPPVYLPKGESSDSQAVVNTSTAAYKSEQKSTQSNGSSLTLNLEKTWDDSIASLDYSIRWDFSDIAYFNIFSKKFYLSLNPIGSWNITDNTKFKMYGFSINPWRIIIKEEEAPVNATGIFANKEKDENIKPQNKKKVRFSLYPIYNDLTKDLDSQIKDMLLNESFKGRLPGWEQTDRKTKKLFMNDLLFIGDKWDIPVINKSKGSLEYLGSEKEKKKE